MRSPGPTFGVEEEYLLLDADTGLPAPRARAVQAAADPEPALGDELDTELLQAQVEVATPVCGRLDEAAAHLERLRGAVARAAARVGCRVAATGGAPLSTGLAMPVTPQPRYLEMRADAARLVDEQLINGMHVHIAVPDRDTGAAALAAIRPWLPVVVALGGNSPFWDGRDTGFASWRTVVFGRWPVSGSPPYAPDADSYEQRADAVLATGVIPDRRQFYWHARLSERYPTLEVRAPDVQLDAESAITLAGLCRALVATALADGDRRPPNPPADVMQAASWHAARHGVAGDLVDPRSGKPAKAAEVAEALLEHVAPALAETGDTERVTGGVDRMLHGGTGAERQRQAAGEGGVSGLVDLISFGGPSRPGGGGNDEAQR
jgi:carboxylate-amine ligase